MPKFAARPAEVFPAAPRASAEPEELSWRERRDWFQARLRQQPPDGIEADELEVHFSAMPARYWERVSERDLVWGLEAVHGFLRLVSAPSVPATMPIVSWQQVAETSRTRILLCTWDRQGLLAKAAAALSAVRLNILEADAFTRADNVVLDVFCAVDADNRTGVNPTRLQEMTFLLEGALSEPPRFASVWACSRHKFLAPPGRFPPRIAFDNHFSSDSTLLRVEASDRLGLLYDILQSIADSGLNITQAHIQTDDETAHDTLHITDALGRKILEPRRLEELRGRLEAALTVKP